MKLGEQIVSEFELDRSDDILGRWIAHHIAALMHATETAQKTGTPEQATQAARECREAILEVWQHRSAWPQGWPPPRAAKMAKLLDGLDDQTYGALYDRSLLGAMQAAHHRLLAAIVDYLTDDDGESIESRWLDKFGDMLTEDEVAILERATKTRSRMYRRADPASDETGADDDSNEHPVLKLATEYRDFVAAALAPRTDADASEATYGKE